MARPRKEVNWEEVDKLCMIHCTAREVSDWFDVSEDTLDRRCKEENNCGFADYYDKKKGTGKISLRRRQFQKAMDGDTAMLIWLGKNWLGQADKEKDEAARDFNITYNYEPNVPPPKRNTDNK